MIGTYRITHPFTGMFYIGSTENFIKRRHYHLSDLRRGVHVNEMLQYNFNLDKKLIWEFTEQATIEDARAHELHLIHDNVDNIAMMNQVGRPRTDVVKEAISASWTIERKAEHATAMAIAWTDDKRLAHSAVSSERWTDEERAKKSIAVKEQWSPERREAMSKASLKSWTPERKAKAALVEVTDRQRTAPTEKLGYPISVDGIVYPSASFAAKAFGISKSSAKRRAKSSKYPNWQFN
jgi:hypothetical protein